MRIVNGVEHENTARLCQRFQLQHRGHHGIVGKMPLSYVGVNSIGLRRRGFTSEKINHILDIYRILFVKHHNVSIALDIIEAEVPASDERDEIIRFIRESVRGIMKGFTPRYDNNNT